MKFCEYSNKSLSQFVEYYKVLLWRAATAIPATIRLGCVSLDSTNGLAYCWRVFINFGLITAPD